MPVGGYRSGAGRKTQAMVEYQELRGTTVRRLVEPHWEAIVTLQLNAALQGNLDALKWLTPWILGSPPSQSTLDVFHHDDPPPVTWDRLPWQDPVWLAQRAQRILDEAARLHLIDGSSRPLDEPNVELPPPTEP